MVKEEQKNQAVLIRDFRRGSGEDVADFNHWMSTRHGENGWRVDL